MSDSEQFLKDHLCPNCHAAIMEDHQEDKFKIQNIIKCPLCGFSCIIKKEINKLNKILNGRNK